MRAMPLDALAEAAARLESGLAPANPPRLAWEPPSPLEAVRAWLVGRGIRRGAHAAYNVALRQSFEAHARGAGWELDSLDVKMLGRVMRQLGFAPVCQSGMRGFRVDRDSARALRHLAPSPKPTVRRVTRKPHALRPVRPPFWPVRWRSMPLVDTLGRVWPSARIAAACLPRASHRDIQRAALKGLGAVGCLWRYLTPEEVRCIPPTARAGDVLPALAWGGTVTVRCEVCGGAGRAA